MDSLGEVIKKIEDDTDFGSKYKECDNPLCGRVVLKDEVYCCHACLAAHVNGYEIPSQGLLSHPERCNKNHREIHKV